MLHIDNLHVEVEKKPIVKGITLDIPKGKITALMGPNGGGKSTLAHTIMGNPKYGVTEGSITYDGEDITQSAPDERAKKGLFMSFQYPSSIPGVTIEHLLRTAINATKETPLSILEVKKHLKKCCEKLSLDPEILSRYVNDGFSGGEKKRAEMLQMLALQPQLVILDETDSGLDIDALKVVAKGVKAFMSSEKTVLIITHYKRILELLPPDEVHILKEGKIVASGDKTLVDELEEKGYGWIEE